MSRACARVLVAEGGAPELTGAVREAYHRFRHRVFKERLGWDVPSRGEQEADAFDALRPVYVMALEGSEVVGAMRFLPTLGPYMLSDVFPVLLNGEPAPRAARVWEISRFASAPADPEDRSQAHINAIVHEMFRHGYHWAVAEGIDEIVLATSVAVERIIRHGGIPLRRFGNGASHRIGHVRSVGCRFSVDAQLENTLFGAHGAAAHAAQRRVAVPTEGIGAL